MAAASRYPLAAGLSLDLLPIVEDGLFGYELSPDRDTHTYVTIGCNAQGEPVLRQAVAEKMGTATRRTKSSPDNAFRAKEAAAKRGKRHVHDSASLPASKPFYLARTNACRLIAPVLPDAMKNPDEHGSRNQPNGKAPGYLEETRRMIISGRIV